MLFKKALFEGDSNKHKYMWLPYFNHKFDLGFSQSLTVE